MCHEKEGVLNNKELNHVNNFRVDFKFYKFFDQCLR